MFCMSLPRQDVLSRIIVNIEDTGFNAAFPSVYHTFSSGFPKAFNIQKHILKHIEQELKEQGVTNIEWE